MGDGRVRMRVAGLGLAVGLLVGAGACSDGDSDPVAPSATTSATGPTTTIASGGTTPTTSTAATTATTVAGPPTTAVPASGEVTIRATVSSVFASARVLQLDPAVDGYSRAALTSETVYRLADGSPGSLQDVDDGSKVDVTGEPGAPGTLIARLVVVVG